MPSSSNPATTLSSPRTEAALSRSDSSRLVMPKFPALGRWLAVLGLGLALTVGGVTWSYLQRQEVIDQAQAVGDAHAAIEALRRWVLQASISEASPAELGQIHTRLIAEAALLPSAKDSLTSLAQMTQGWPVADVARGQAAATNLPLALSAWRRSDDAIGRQSTLASGIWGARLSPVRTQLASLDPATLTKVFEPREDRLKLQVQWAESMKSYAQNTTSLAQASAQDVSLPSSARQAIADWAASWQKVATATTTLAETGAARVQAQGWSNALSPMTVRAEGSLSVPKLRVGLPQGLLILGLLIAILGAFGVMSGLQKMSQYRRSQALLGQRRREALESLERLTQQLVSVNQGDRTSIQEDSRSPGYRLSALINGFLSTRQSLLEEVDRQQSQQGKSLDQLRRLMREFRLTAQTEHVRAEQEGRKRLSQAQSLATLGQQAKRFQGQVHEMGDQFRQSHAAVQETNWRNEALREGTQGQAKNLKRLSEGTQGLALLVDNIQAMARRLYVQSMNAGIEAAHLGTSGRKLSLRAQEMETLASTTIQAAQEVTQSLRHIQDDAQSTLNAMEENTTNVVETGNRAAQAARILQDLERHVQSVHEGTERVLDGLEARAVDDAQAAQAAEANQAELTHMQTQIGEMDQVTAQAIEDGQTGFSALVQSLRALPGT